MHRALLVLLTLVAACTPGADGGSSPSTTATTAPITTTVPAGPASDGDPVCLRGDRPFVTSGTAGTAVRAESDARRLGSVTWELHGVCERVVLGFTTETGAPSVDPPGMASAFVRDSGVIRISLGGEVDGSAVDEQLVDGDLVGRVFVVRGLDGDRFVDVHLQGPAFARVTTAGGPGRVVVDVRPGGPPYAVEPIRADGLLLVEYPAETTAYPFSVSGYTAIPGAGVVEASVEASGEGDDGATSVIPARVATGDRGWRSFVLLVPDGPAGTVALTLADLIDLSLTTGP